MKKKISVFALLFSLLLAVPVPAAAPVPVQAANSTEITADDVKYRDIEDFMHGAGYTDFVKTDGAIYIVRDAGEVLYIHELVGALNLYSAVSVYKEKPVLIFFTDNAHTAYELNVYEYYDFVKASQTGNYTLQRSYSDAFAGCDVGQYVSCNYMGTSANKRIIYYDTLDSFVYSEVDIFQAVSDGGVYSRNYDTVLYYSNLEQGYSFPAWCEDAGLNCLASTNESATVIPYSYNSYWHIVRKSSSGNWLLTTIGSTLGQSKMNLRLSDSGDLIIYEFSGDDSFVISVRQYVYDTDGWKVRTYDTYEYDDFSSGLLTLPAGSGIDDTRVLAYTSTDIYSSDGLSVYAAASTEYVEPSSPDVTPEPTPGSGSSGSDDSGSSGSGSSGGGRPGTGTRPSVGGEASGGGGLDFIINLFTLIWTKICAVPMAVDGYSISLQQIFVYGALVSIVGGFIIKFIFRR